jgi:autotransporter passenger strand-loop-strand repeat protein
MTIVSSGQTLNVSSGQTSHGIIVLTGGTLNALSGGSIINAVDSGGTDNVSSGGTAIDTVVNNGGVEQVFFAGSAIGTTVNGASEHVSSGGTVINMTLINGGAAQVFSGGSAIGTTLSNGAEQEVDGTAMATTVNFEGALLRRHYPASTLLRPCPTPARAVACRDVEAATLAHDGSPPITHITFPTCHAHYPADRTGARVDCFPARAAFPKWQEGPHPHCHFRGLLRLHSCYGPPDCSAAQGDLCHEAPALPVTRPSRSSATGSIDNSPGGILLHW